MNNKTLVDDPKAVDVSGLEAHYEVRCRDVHLLSSQLQAGLSLKRDDEHPRVFASKLMEAWRGIQPIHPSVCR